MSAPRIRNAFVLGAGLGTRLRGLTARKPKPLIPVVQKPLITFAFDHLLRNGVETLVVNTHHCHEAYDEAFPDARYRDCALHFRHEPHLLETAGGIKNVEDLLDAEPFVVYNGDILTDVPIERAIAEHFNRENEVTMVLRSKDGPLHVSLEDGRVTDIASRIHPKRAGKFLFTGLYVVSPEFLTRIPARTKLSVIPIFLQMIQRGAKLGGIVLDEGHWWDLGTRDKYLDVHRHFLATRESFGSNGRWPVWIHPTARVAPSAEIRGATVIGAEAEVCEGAVIEDCVVWERAEVGPDARLKECILTAGAKAGGIHTGADF